MEKLDVRLRPLVRIVDDDDVVRTSESFVLRLAGYDVQAFESAELFLASDDRARCGALVLDIRMPGMSGMELQQKMREEGRTLPILFLTGHGDIDMAVTALRRGAADFLQKPMKAEALTTKVKKLVDWHCSVCREHDELENVAEKVATLTPKEKEASELAAKGLQNREIASVMGISEQTVRIHRWNASKKLDVKNAAETADVLRSAAASKAPIQYPFVEEPET